MVLQRKLKSQDLLKEVKARGVARDQVAEIFIKALEILSGDRDALNELAGRSVLKQICVSYLFDASVPSKENLLDLKLILENLAENAFDRELILFVTNPIQEGAESLKKNYPLWLLQQLIILSDLERKPLFEEDDTFNSVHFTFDSFLSYSHYTLVENMIDSEKFRDFSIESFEPYISIIMDQEPTEHLLTRLVETNLKVEEQDQVTSYKIVIQRLLKEDSDRIIDLIHEKRGEYFFQSESAEGESNALWELSLIHQKE